MVAAGRKPRSSLFRALREEARAAGWQQHLLLGMLKCIFKMA